MATPDVIEALTAAEYLRAERTAQSKSEYVDGHVYGMSGASAAHNRLMLNLAFLLNQHVDDGPCEVYAADMKVHVEAANAYYYPDILVTCDERDASHAYFKEAPKVIIEVLSPSTERRDRGDRFLNYQKLPSLREYVLISGEGRVVEHYARLNDTEWVYQPLGEDDILRLGSIDFSAPLTDIYKKVSFEAAATEPEDLNL